MDGDIPDVEKGKQKEEEEDEEEDDDDCGDRLNVAHLLLQCLTIVVVLVVLVVFIKMLMDDNK